MASIFSLFGSSANKINVGIEDIRAARERIRSDLALTPLSFSPGLSELFGLEIFLKWENRHKTGSFKERGALNFLSALDAKTKQRGVCASSLGNHALALSYHSKRLGVKCFIFMPTHAPLVKVAATQKNGAEVHLIGNSLDEAREACMEFARERGLTYVSPYDHPLIVAGQGTAGLEILEQLSDFDGFVTPIGGGGLGSGIAIALKDAKPNLYIVGAQSEWAKLQRQNPKAQHSALPLTSIADGIAVKTPGSITEPIIKSLFDKVIPVSESEIAKAVVEFLEAEKGIIEGAAAAAFAALYSKPFPPNLKRVVVVVSGSNIDINLLARLIERDMNQRGRILRIIVSVPDKPGSLYFTSGVLAKAGANVLEVVHDRSHSDIPGNVDISFLLEVKNLDHKANVLAELERSGISTREI